MLISFAKDESIVNTDGSNSLMFCVGLQRVIFGLLSFQYK
jgi:hypothetical protein